MCEKSIAIVAPLACTLSKCARWRAGGTKETARTQGIQLRDLIVPLQGVPEDPASQMDLEVGTPRQDLLQGLLERGDPDRGLRVTESRNTAGEQTREGRR